MAFARPGVFQPENTISLQLAATITGPSPKKGAAVKVFATAETGILELVDLVPTAIDIDTIENQESFAKPIFDPKKSPPIGTAVSRLTRAARWAEQEI